MRFGTEPGLSLIDGKPALIMHYGDFENPAGKADLADEIRKLDEGLYLGVGTTAKPDGTRVHFGHFALSGPMGEWIGVDDEIRDAARSASWNDIASGRAQSRALGAVDAYTKFMTFGLADPNTRRWAYDQEQAKIGQEYGEAGGWAFAVISGKDLPRLLGKGLMALGRGGVRALPALLRTGNRPVGELLRGLGSTLAKTSAALSIRIEYRS